MKTPALATGPAITAIIAILVSGCTSGSSGPDAADGTTSVGTPSAPESSPAPSASRPTATPSPTGKAEPEKKTEAQEWADAAYASWFKGMQYTYIEDPDAGMFCDEFDDIAGYRECVPNDPHAYIESFTATASGHLVVTVSPDSRWEGGTYDTLEMPGLFFVSGNIGTRLEADNFTFVEVTAKLDGINASYTYRQGSSGTFS